MRATTIFATAEFFGRCHVVLLILSLAYWFAARSIVRHDYAAKSGN